MNKILVVDNQIDDRTSIKQILEKNKFKVTAVASGAAAITTFKKRKFDAVLVDILMPKMSGYKVLKNLKKIRKKTPVIYVTVLPPYDVNMKGADGFIQKPFKPAELIKNIKRILNEVKK